MMSPGRVFLLVTIASLFAGTSTLSQGRGSTVPPAAMLLKPARVFDGDAVHEGWAILVRGT